MQHNRHESIDLILDNGEEYTKADRYRDACDQIALLKQMLAGAVIQDSALCMKCGHARHSDDCVNTAPPH